MALEHFVNFAILQMSKNTFTDGERSKVGASLSSQKVKAEFDKPFLRAPRH
jgi:hypothetical protein